MCCATRTLSLIAALVVVGSLELVAQRLWVDSAAVSITRTVFPVPGPGDTYSWDAELLDGDTVVAGRTYRKVLRSQVCKSSYNRFRDRSTVTYGYTFQLVGLVREEGDRVYLRGLYPPDDCDRLLYDYAALPGDTVWHCCTDLPREECRRTGSWTKVCRVDSNRWDGLVGQFVSSHHEWGPFCEDGYHWLRDKGSVRGFFGPFVSIWAIERCTYDTIPDDYQACDCPPETPTSVGGSPAAMPPLRVVPSPARPGEAIRVFAGSKGGTLEVYDLHGRLAFRAPLPRRDAPLEIEPDVLSPGAYVLRAAFTHGGTASRLLTVAQ